MNIKTGVLAAVAALSLAVPAAALAQPFYGRAPGYVVSEDFSRAPGFAVREEFRRDDGRRFDRALEFRRLEDLRRLRWEREREREHDYRYGYRAYR